MHRVVGLGLDSICIPAAILAQGIGGSSSTASSRPPRDPEAVPNGLRRWPRRPPATGTSVFADTHREHGVTRLHRVAMILTPALAGEDPELCSRGILT